MDPLIKTQRRGANIVALNF